LRVSKIGAPEISVRCGLLAFKPRAGTVKALQSFSTAEQKDESLILGDDVLHDASLAG
jgi:hypothetical protein